MPLDTPPRSLTDALSTPETPAVSVVSVALYVDADNQSAQCAAPLLNLFRTEFKARVVSATIAGNNLGQKIDDWRSALLAEDPDLAIQALPAPHRKNGADIVLLMALGAALDAHLSEQTLVVVVSRDDLLIGAAEQAKARGCKTLVAYADSDIPTARNTQLTTLLLPALKPANAPWPKSVSVVQPPPVVIQASKPEPPVQPMPLTVGKDAKAVLAKVRGLCKQQPGGGYPASAVGQALQKLGYDKAARASFLKSTPGLKKMGSGANLRYLF
ncbi:NYN domain-containing protein [Thiocapsa bogorovii]|uniref:NYN domain-containing protein n=1 Tax=Thiocapsa bogorovii TaxID=521689 RepID=UPI001E64B20A|nr:NYN domain-containing protein [Thiocapsa bogorovii]UHD18430.1 NYN domain-containing protein [Thiocapsa bogorovii]